MAIVQVIISIKTALCHLLPIYNPPPRPLKQRLKTLIPLATVRPEPPPPPVATEQVINLNYHNSQSSTGHLLYPSKALELSSQTLIQLPQSPHRRRW